LFALGRVRFLQGDLAAAAHAFQAALVREPSFVEARVAWAEVLLEQGEQARARDALLTALQRTPDHSRAALLLAELQPASSDGAGVAAACARDESTSPFIASACDLSRAHRAWRGHDWDAAVELANAAGHRQPVEPRVLGGAVQLLASAGAVDRATSCLDAADTGPGPTLPAFRWARIAVELGRGLLVDLPRDLPAGSSPWASLLAARIALASGGMKELVASLPDLEVANAELKALAAVAKENQAGDADGKVPRMEPVLAYVKGMQARLAGKPALAADLLAEALAGHGDACRAAGEYLAACEAVGRVPDASAFFWLLGNNARCVNLPAAFAAADQKQGRKPARRAVHGSN
jgi:tetratricopeptide (TPR) repeat protein